MAIFDRFRRNREQSVLPDEVKNYYSAEQRQRRGMAVVFALLGLVLTILVAAALFFGGRAIYRAVTKDDARPGQTSSTNTTNQSPSNQDSGTSGQRNNGGSTTPAPNPQTQSATPTPAPNPTPAPASTPTPAPAPSTNLPRTGDEGM